MTKTQVDRLGDRLKRGDASDEDLSLLDSFRRLFAPAFEGVVRAIRDELGLEPTSRSAKSRPSIVEKLRRESIRLTQMQDIAGCRLVVEDSVAQNRVVEQLVEWFPVHAVFDRRQKPSHGYRAVHVIVTEEGNQVEIQVRTQLQHLWAELSEKLSDVMEPAIKYGGGDDGIRGWLSQMSDNIATVERMEDVLHLQASTVTEDSLEQARRELASLLRWATDLAPTLVKNRE